VTQQRHLLYHAAFARSPATISRYLDPFRAFDRLLSGSGLNAMLDEPALRRRMIFAGAWQFW